MERVNGYLASRPKDARGRFLKGLILTEQNKPNEAIKVFTDLSQDYPELPEPYNNLAVLYASQGQYDKARNCARDGDPHASELCHRAREPRRHLREDGEPGLRQGAAARPQQPGRAGQAEPDQGSLLADEHRAARPPAKVAVAKVEPTANPAPHSPCLPPAAGEVRPRAPCRQAAPAAKAPRRRAATRCRSRRTGRQSRRQARQRSNERRDAIA